MIIFYCENIDTDNTILEGEEFKHCCKVLRHKIGDLINITNGDGTFAEAKIISIGKNEASISIISRITKNEEKRKINLIVAPPKNRARWEWILEKVTEIGVTQIIPVITDNSERKKINLIRNKKIVQSAALQSKRVISQEFLK